MKALVVVIAAALNVALLAKASAATALPPDFIARTTNEGCVVYEWTPQKRQAQGPDNTVSWNGPCEQGKPITGHGTLRWDFLPTSRNIYRNFSCTAQIVGGYYDGRWACTGLRLDNADITDDRVWHMGCLDSNASCTPAANSEDIAASEPDPEASPEVEPVQPAPAAPTGAAGVQIDTVLQLGSTCVTARAVQSDVAPDGSSVQTTVELMNACPTAQIVATYLATVEPGYAITNGFSPQGPSYVVWKKALPKLPFEYSSPDFAAFTMRAGEATTTIVQQQVATAHNLIFKSAACDYEDAKGVQQTMFRDNDIMNGGFSQAVCMTP